VAGNELEANRAGSFDDSAAVNERAVRKCGMMKEGGRDTRSGVSSDGRVSVVDGKEGRQVLVILVEIFRQASIRTRIRSCLAEHFGSSGVVTNEQPGPRLSQVEERQIQLVATTCRNG
jgi:hypothetical protein